MLRCSSCATENAPGARFCAQCGARLGETCPACGVAVTPDQKFCASCGAALRSTLPSGTELGPQPVAYTPPHLAQRILATRHAIHGEKKQVTVLFCDIVSSTELASALGPEAMHDLLSAFLKVSLAEVHHFEGTVNQFLGDGFMAIFGAPLAYEDHASRAARAALAIRQAVGSRAPADAPIGWDRLQLRMGLNSGQVVVGAIGDDLRMDYTASGDTTHLAARLQALAAPGEILCGEATVRAAKGLLVTEGPNAVTVKGIAQPIATFRLSAVEDQVPLLIRPRTRFVGRGNEITVLRKALERTAAGQGGVIEIEGEAGVGKTRLLAEYAGGLGEDARVVRCHCVAYGRQAPNVPIIELVRGLCGIERGDTESVADAAIARALGPELRGDADLLGALLGHSAAVANTATRDPATARARTTQHILHLVTLAAGAAPLVVMVEDLHWADASSLDFLTTIVAHSGATRCLMLVTFRPGSEPPWQVLLRLERLRLAPLPAADARLLVGSLDQVAVIPAQTLSRVLIRAEGNPFFLEELVRAAVHGSDEIPGDVFDVLGARIDRLDPHDKDLLRIGAVIGREFALDLVEEVAGGAERARSRFERLTRGGFVEPIAGTGRFAFVHALTQEVVYNSMLTPDRKGLHTAVAERLAGRTLTAVQASEEIARHHLQGLIPAAAIPFLETSIARAIRHHALEAANDFFHDALRLLEAEPATPENAARRIGLLLQQFPVFHFTHRHAEYAALIERYVPIVEALGVPALRGPFLAQRGHRLWVAAHYAEAKASLREAVAICAEVGDAASAAYAECMLTWTYANEGNCDAAEAHGLAAVQWLEQCPVPMLQTFTHVGLLLAHAFRGGWRAALAAGERAREAGVLARDDGLASFGGSMWSFAASASGDLALARDLAARALAEAPTDYFRGWASAYLALALARSGQAEQGLPILEPAVTLARASSHISGYLLIALHLAEVRLIAGQVEAARSLAEQLRAEAQDFPYVMGGCEQVLAEIALVTGDTATALGQFQSAQAIFTRIGAADAGFQARFGEGRALAAAGDLPAARAAYVEALAGFERLGTRGAPERVRAAIDALGGRPATG